MGFIFFLLVLIVLVGSAGILYIVLFNRLMTCRSKIEQSESIIDECLRNKYDFLVNANSIVCGILKTEKNYFKDIDKIKDQDITNFDFDRKLIEYVSILEQLKQDYNNIEQNKDIKKISSDIKAINEKLEAAKAYYNKYTNKSNELARSFPSNIIAKLHNVEIKAFFDGKDMQDDIIDDFKI